MSQESGFQFKPAYDGTKVSKRRYRRHDAWDDHKEFILDMVKTKARQETILKALAEERGFDTKLNQLKRQLGIWGISKKNLKAKQRKWVFLTHQRRELEGKETRFYFGDTRMEVGESQIDKILGASANDFPDNLAASPGDLEISTPPAAEPDEDDIDIILEDEPGPEPQESQDSNQEHANILNEGDIAAPSLDIPAEIVDEPPPAPVHYSEPIDVETQAEQSSEDSNSEVQARFDQLYKEVSQLLDSLHLAANISAVGESSPIREPKWDWPGPNTNEYAKDLQIWMEEAFDDAKHFMEVTEGLSLTSGMPFEYCSAFVTEAWKLKHDEEPLPYHVNWAIANGECIPPMSNIWELVSPKEHPISIGYKIPSYIVAGTELEPSLPEIDERRTVQRQAWVPVTNPVLPVLSDNEWNRIDSLHQRYYGKLRKRYNKLKNRGLDLHEVRDFQCRAAHLQYLRYTFGELHFFTFDALEAFGTLFFVYCQDIKEILFLRECVLKLCTAMGLSYHSRVSDIYREISDLHRVLGNHSAALEYAQKFYTIAGMIWGWNSISAIQSIPNIAYLDFKLGDFEHGEFVLGEGLSSIHKAVSEIPKDSHKSRNIMAKTLIEIGRIYKKTNRTDIAQKIFRFALKELTIFRKTYDGRNPDKGGRIPNYMAQGYYHLKDYDNAMVMFQSAFHSFVDNYGERDDRSLESMEYLCKTMSKRGLAIYTVPILEKWWRIHEATEKTIEEGEEGLVFEIWMHYMRLTFRVQGYGEELEQMQRQLEWNA